MKPIKRAIIACWVMLVACFAIKLFGGNWFEVVCTNEHFLNICNFLDNHLFFQDFIAICLYIFSTYFMVLSCSLLIYPNKKQKIAILVVLISIFISQYVNEYIKFFSEIFMFISMPIILRVMDGNNIKRSIKKYWYCGFVGLSLITAFQLISMFVRNIEFWIMKENTLISLMLLTDYYIMIFLYYLYVKQKKGDKANGKVGRTVLQRRNRTT